MNFIKKSILLSLVLIVTIFMVNGSLKAQTEIKMSYNGPADTETNPVHAFAARFKKIVESNTEGEVKITLFPNSQLGNEEQRMTQTMSMPMINVASNAGMTTVTPEIYGYTIPFMFKNYKAAHIFFEESKYWEKVKNKFKKDTGVVLLEAIEEGGFLAFTNSRRMIKSPADFKGLKFRAMDKGQIKLYEAFGASGVPIPWTETYTSLQTGVADGQMNPPTYIISGSLYEVQDYMTMANIQYSCQFLTINEELFNSLSEKNQNIIKKAANKANITNRIKVEAKVEERVNFIKENGVEVYHPDEKEMKQFREKGQPPYISWLKTKVSAEWIDLALESAKKANQKSTQ